MKILFVFTGGTIGSAENGGVADVDHDVSLCISKFVSNNKTNTTIDTAFPYNILSENSDTKTLSDICTYMLSVNYDNYDGVIITHGSDTLAYTANILALVLSGVKIPVIITAADYVMTDPRSNAFSNIETSVRFIESFIHADHSYNGVFAIWKNRDDVPEVHNAFQLLEADAACDKFTSWGGKPLARFSDHKFDFSGCRVKTPIILPTLKGNSIDITNNVVLLHSYVGLDYNTVNIKGKSAVLLKLYHSGTACMKGEGTAFHLLAEKCEEEGADLYITPSKQGSYIYSSAEGLLSSNANPIYNMSETAAYCALLLAYSLEEKYSDIIIKFITGGM